jgi:hypothetical protein
VLKRDLTRLSIRVREAAIDNPNGGVRWPADVARDAINELDDTGSVILGLDLWPDEEGEIAQAPLSAYPGGATEPNIEPARFHAIEALRRVPGFGWSNPSILVTCGEPV